MDKRNPAGLTDEELLREAKKMRSASIINAVLIGCRLIGTVLYGIMKSGWGFFTLVPLFLAYKLANKPGYDRQELERLFKERNLK